MTTEQLLWAALSLAGLIGSILCNGAELGMYSLNRVRLNLRVAEAGRRRAAGQHIPLRERAALWLKSELDRPDRALAAMLIANTLFSDFGAMGLTGLLEARGFTDGQIIALNAAILTPLLFVFAETLPKELFRLHADRLTYKLAWFLRGSRLAFTYTGVLPLVQHVVALITRLAGLSPETKLESRRERMAALLKEGARHGVLSESQTTLLDRALALRTATVGDEMVPWSRVRVLRERSARAPILETLRSAPFSRYPVIDASGRPAGIVEHADLTLNAAASLRELTRPAITLAPELPVRAALLQLGTSGQKMAIVMRGGRPVGIVTAKDLVEPLTGELVAW